MTPKNEAKMETVPAWMTEAFDELNQRHFDGSLPPAKFGVSKLRDQFAFYAPVVHMIFFHPRTLDQDRKFIADTLLHEMVHYALELRTNDPKQTHGADFVRLVNEIGATLGLPAVAEDEEAVLTWPQSVRPADYAPWR